MGNTGMVKDPRDLDVAVVGVGGWGKNHARVLMDLGVLAAICDANAERANGRRQSTNLTTTDAC